MLIPSSACHPVIPFPCPHPFLPPLVRFPELGVSHVLLTSLIFPPHFLSFPLYSLSLFFIFPKWMRPYNVCPSPLTYFTQHNTLQFHPRWSKWWVFVVCNGWVIFNCIHRPHIYLFIFRWTTRLLPQFGYCGHCYYKHWDVGVPMFYYICIFGVNPQQCNCWVVGQVFFWLFIFPFVHLFFLLKFHICGLCIQWNITQLLEMTNTHHLLQRGWNWRVLCWVKEVNLRRTNIIWSHWFGEYKK